MLQEYVDVAMASAHYEIIKNSEPFYGKIPVCRGVWAMGKSLEECRKNLQEVLEGWILFRTRRGLTIPSIKGRKVKPIEKIPVHA